MRRFEVSDDGSAKFWEIAVEGASMTVRYGRIGAAGQSKVKTLDDAASARAEEAKLIREKTGKGYVEVGAAAAPQAPAAPPRTDAAAPAPASASDDDVPSSTPRRGRLTWLVPPAGGHDWLGANLDGALAVHGDAALLLRPSGELVRFDLRTLASEQLSTHGVVFNRYHHVAIRGERWVLCIGKPQGEQDDRHGTWLDGRKLDAEPLDTACIASDGTVLGFRGQKIVRVDASGVVRWEGGKRGTLLAASGTEPVVAWYGGALLPDGHGDLREVRSTLTQTPDALFASARFAVVTHWMQSPTSSRNVYVASVWSLASGDERTVELSTFGGAGVIVGERLVWPGGDLDLETLETRAFVVPSYGPIDRITPVSESSGELLALSREGAVRRFQLPDQSPITKRPIHVAHPVWDVGVARDGRVAVGRDEGCDVWSASGEHARHVGEGACSYVSFSPAGDLLALATDVGTVVLDATFAEVARCELAGPLAFSPDGARVLLGDAGKLLVSEARTLRTQVVLTAKGYPRGRFSGGKIVAEGEGSVFVYDDPGSVAAAKKPPKQAPAKRLSGAADGVSSCCSEHLGELVAVRGTDQLALVDAHSGKVVERANVDVRLSRTGRVLAVRDGQGASLWRWGERTPFASLPYMPELIDASPDGSTVVAEVARGVIRWTEEGGRTPASPPFTYALPVPSGPRQLPGFSDQTQAFVVHGVVLRVPSKDAATLAQALVESVAGVVAIPEGDASSTGAPRDTIPVHVGFVIASADADAQQGRKGERAAFEASAFDIAERAFVASRAALVEVLARVAPALDARNFASEDAATTHLVACGPLSSAELTLGRKLLRLTWDGPDDSLPVTTRSAGSIVCWND